MRKKRIEDLIEEKTDLDLDYSEIRNKIDFSRYEKPKPSLFKRLIPLVAVAAALAVTVANIRIISLIFGGNTVASPQNEATLNGGSDNEVAVPGSMEEFTFELTEEAFDEFSSLETAKIMIDYDGGDRRVSIETWNEDIIDLDGEVRYFDKNLKETSIDSFVDRETVYAAFSSGDYFKVVYVFKK